MEGITRRIRFSMRMVLKASSRVSPWQITGARWGLQGAEAILRLRALRVNGDLDDYLAWKEAREHEAIHLSRYADGKPPTLVGPGRPRPQLRLVS